VDRRKQGSRFPDYEDVTVSSRHGHPAGCFPEAAFRFEPRRICRLKAAGEANASLSERRANSRLALISPMLRHSSPFTPSFSLGPLLGPSRARSYFARPGVFRCAHATRSRQFRSRSYCFSGSLSTALSHCYLHKESQRSRAICVLRVRRRAINRDVNAGRLRHPAIKFCSERFHPFPLLR